METAEGNPAPDAPAGAAEAPEAPAPAPQEAGTLTEADESIVRAWLAYGTSDDPDEVPDPDAILQGEQLLTRRGKLYYDPTPDAEGRVCIGAPSRSRPDQKIAYTGHTMVPLDLQAAVAALADVTDPSPRGHQ